MNLDLFNHKLEDINKDELIQNFMNELSNFLEKNEKDDLINMNSLKKEDCLYQVVDMAIDGAYLENKNDHKIYKETDISKDTLDKIGNDTILRYKNGEYIIEDELTEEFFKNLK